MSLFAELKRRNVIRVTIAYLALAWLLTEVAGTLFPVFGLPVWGVRFIVIILTLGLIPTLVFSWAYEITPEGLKREKDVVREASITHFTAKRLDGITIGLIMAALVFIVADRFWLSPRHAEQLAAPVEVVTDNAQASESESTEPQYPPNSIAVLPFVNMSDDAGNEYFSDGISEELLNVLVHINDLRVASRTSSFAFKGENKSLEEIADALKVSYVLEGSVRKAGNRVRITAQLIEVASDRHLWSETYDRDLTDIFAIQSETANAIVAALRDSLEIEVAGEISVPAATTNINAYDLYLEARELFITRTDLEKSVALFEQAVAQDSEFARAWEGLAAVYLIMPSWGYTDRDYPDLAVEAAQTALALDDGLSLAYSVIGYALTVGQPYRWQDLFENYKRASENESKNATNYLWRAIAYMKLGYFELAMSDFERCLSIDPQYGNCQRYKAMLYLLRGERDKGIALVLRTLESVDAENTIFVSAFALNGNRAAALLLADRATYRTGAPIEDWINLIENPNVDRTEAVAAFDRWVKRENIDVNELDPMLIVFGAYDRATHESERVFIFSIWLPEFAEFRQSPHFKRVISEFDMLPFWQSHGFPPQCRPIGDQDFECD
jgi:adenylate cyclase